MWNFLHQDAKSLALTGLVKEKESEKNAVLLLLHIYMISVSV